MIFIGMFLGFAAWFCAFGGGALIEEGGWTHNERTKSMGGIAVFIAFALVCAAVAAAYYAGRWA